MPHTRSATVSVYVGAGSRYEVDAEAGLSHFLEHMLFKGASRRPTAAMISEAIETMGGHHNAATDREATVYYAKVPGACAAETIDILADMVCDPVMDAAELEKERAVILEELASVEDSPDELASILIDETLWPGQPLGRNVGGTPSSVRSLPLSAVEAYRKRQYVGPNIVLAVAGNVEHDAVMNAAARWFAPLPDAAPGDWYPVQAEPAGPRVVVKAKETEQAHLCIAFPTVSLFHPDRYAVDILSAVLGEGMSSRLFLELREERALVYDIHTYLGEFRDAGCLTVYAGSDPEHARTTIEVSLEQIARLTSGGLSTREFEKARRMVLGRMQLRMEDTRAVAGWIGSQELLTGEVLTVDEVCERVERVTLDDTLRAAREYLQPSRAVAAIVGPFDDDASFAGLL